MTRARRRMRRAVRHLRRHARLPLVAAAAVVVIAVVAVVTAGYDAPRDVRAAVASPATATGRPVAVIGDSISEGTPYGGKGAANWAQRVGAERQWTVTNTAVGGTGYVNPGSAGPFEATQLERVVAARPQLVVVEGSRNDIGLPVEAVRAAASHLYGELRTRLPGARIVVVGPFWDEKTSQKAYAWRDALAGAARAAGADFVDPMAERCFAGAYDGGPLIGPDRVHPTDAGHARYAERLRAALDRLGV
ncbi:SGNH/GDSL hydrolase family protein [Actinomycetospora sp. OC33-EN08]|uniref:SGNH/GDSL hydrolase family protein n=1 Tax=Actinomycetospora aurantiaca TaxID=3129233 RepID=A0ABU8MHS8_9PSEU